MNEHEESIARSEWYWIAPIALHLILNKLGDDVTFGGQLEGIEPKAKGVTFTFTQNETLIIQVQIERKDGKTEISVTESESAKARGLWPECKFELGTIAANAWRMRRRALGVQFSEILSAYYEAVERGESPNLHEMATAAGVNYGSLRQFKIRFDKKRRE